MANADAINMPRKTDAPFPKVIASANVIIDARAPDYGADPIELVSTVRPQSAEVHREHFQREAGGLYEGDAVFTCIVGHGQAGGGNDPGCPVTMIRGRDTGRRRV